MTGMRIQEWSALLLPEPGLTDGHRPAVAALSRGCHVYPGGVTLVWVTGNSGTVDVLPGLKSRDSGLGRLTLPGASCFTALCGHVCPSYRRSTGV